MFFISVKKYNKKLAEKDRMSAYKQIPNLLSIIRVFISILLFFLFEKFYLFISFYLLAALTDVLDGSLARKINVQSSLGAKLDSLGDLAFYAVLITYLAMKHSEILNPFMVFIIFVCLFRVANVVFGFIKYKRLIMIHTIANKLTGFLVFLLPLLIWFKQKELLIVVMIISFISPIEEFLIILQSQDKIELNRRTLYHKTNNHKRQQITGGSAVDNEIEN